MRTLILLLAFPVFAQMPPLDNAKLQTKAFVGSVESTIQQLGSGPFWAAWREPARPGQKGDMCDWNSSRTQIHLEGITQIVMLVRVEAGKIDKLRVTSADCRLDAGGLPFYWIEGVPPQQSVAWLKPQVTANHTDPAMFAIAMHESAISEPVLDEFATLSQPDKIRSKAAFWLGVSGGKHGLDTLSRMLANDPSEQVRREVTFGLSQSKEPEALPLLIQTAKSDRTPSVRGQAVFWLAQKAGNKQAAQVVGDAINDPDRQVKEKAVFAVSQFPNGEGIPKLIDLAKSNRDPEIRKKAMFWLGQSKDSRALDFIESVLR